MAIQEYALLRNRTNEPVRFTFGGQTETVKAGDKYIADAGLVKFLFEIDDAIQRVTSDDRRVFALGIEECPPSWQDVLDPDCFDTATVAVKAIRETPALAVSRAVKYAPVSISPADFRPDAETR